MGYNLAIGEAKLETCEDDNLISITVEPLESPSCPNFIDSDRSNYRHPSYSQWSNWCESVGLHDLFLDRESRVAIIQNHPGAYLITEETYSKFKIAYDKFKSKHPTAKPVTWDRMPDNYKDLGWKEKMKIEESLPVEDWDVHRFEWLMFWTRWALDNCKNPIFYNS